MSQNETETPFGARFLDEYRRLGGGVGPLGYGLIQEIRNGDREALIRALRSAHPLSTTYATIQLIRIIESPEALALELIRARQAAAAGGATVGLFSLFAMIAALS